VRRPNGAAAGAAGRTALRAAQPAARPDGRAASELAAARRQTNWHGGDCECPFVVERNGLFCLFRNQRYGLDNRNGQYCSA